MDREEDYGLAFTELVRYCGEMLGKCKTIPENATWHGALQGLGNCIGTMAYTEGDEGDDTSYEQAWLDAITCFTVFKPMNPVLRDVVYPLLREKITSLQQEYKI